MINEGEACVRTCVSFAILVTLADICARRDQAITSMTRHHKIRVESMQQSYATTKAMFM